MNKSKLLAIAFAASMVGTTAMAQTGITMPADGATQPQSAELQPALQETGSHPALPAQTGNTMPADGAMQPQSAELQPALQETGSHPALRVQGMVPNEMVYATAQPDTTPVTREQVKAELVAARADGELRADADNSGPVVFDREFMATRSRDEVKNEVALAREDGELATSSDNQPVERVFFVSNTTRAEVKAETTDATRDGMGLSQGDRDHYIGE